MSQIDTAEYIADAVLPPEIIDVDIDSTTNEELESIISNIKEAKMLPQELAEKYPVPWGEIGYITYKRTYARRIKETVKDSPTEEFHDTVERCIKSFRTQLKVGFTEEEEHRLRYYMMSLKGTVAGRFMWQLGTKTVSNLGLASLQNCAFTNVDHPIEPFVWAMDMLMLGSGVGFNIQRENVYQLPKVQRKKVNIIQDNSSAADFIVPDTRAGWCKLLGKVLKAHFYSGSGFTYSTQLVRGKGANIAGFGGVASGPEILIEGMGIISDLLNSRRGKRLRPIDCLDIMNVIGMIIVAGNVRRSAQIAIGDYDDIEFLRAKRWDLGGIPRWRSNSNNSVACQDTSLLPDEFWEGYRGNGEPYGLINIDLAREIGRIGETQYPDPNVAGFNPCAEQSLEPYETCCLAEVPLPLIETEEEFREVIYFLYRICKHSLLLPSHHAETEKVVHKNMRMGIGLTGYAMATKKQKSWLRDAYTYLRQVDVEYSAKLGVPTSIKLTTMKPSGSLSCLTGMTSGCHPAIFPYFIRRITMASDSRLVNVCRENGFHAEYKKNLDGSADHSSVIVSFPAKYPHYSTFASDTTAVDQLNIVKELQTIWSDNAVSVSVYYKLEELDEIRAWLNENYTDSLKSVSFMLHNDHGFAQAPFEEITKEEYMDIVKNTIPIASVEFNESDIDESQIGCGIGCPLK
jgi:ribonucleoside-triphosphate reductase